MDDLIPFLIVILITVIGAISQIKKKRALQQNSTQKPQTNQNDNLFSWLEKLNDPELDHTSPYEQDFDMPPSERPVETIDEITDQEPVKVKTDKKHVKQTGSNSPEKEQKQFKNKYNSPFTKTAHKNDETKQTERKKQSLNQKLNEEFNLKKAVIYSEILKRKYQ